MGNAQVVEQEEVLETEVEAVEEAVVDIEAEASEEETAEAEEAELELEEDVETEGALDEEADSEDDEEIDVVDLAITQEDVRLVEAVLFASSSAVAISQIAERFPEERVSLIPDILKILEEQYESRGVNLVQRAGKWALRTANDLGGALRLEKDQTKKFTRAAMETLAVVAYHQPVTRAEIENIRGVATSPGALDALMEAKWLKPGKRREVPGRPVTWQTTPDFLDHFGLERLQDLPGVEDLKAAGLLDKRPAIEAMPTPDLFDGEGEDVLAQEITNEDLLGRTDDEGDTYAEDASAEEGPAAAYDVENDTIESEAEDFHAEGSSEEAVNNESDEGEIEESGFEEVEAVEEDALDEEITIEDTLDEDEIEEEEV